MSEKILQINYKYTTTAAEHNKLLASVADPIAAVPGLAWKTWLSNERDHEAGGIYLFKDQSSLDAYLAGEIVSAFQKEPTIKDIAVKVFDVAEALSMKTRAPIKDAVAA